MDKKKIIIICAAVLLLLAGLTIAFASPVNDAYFSKKTVHNIKFMGQDAGNKTDDEIKKMVADAVEKRKSVKIDVKGEVIEINAQESGISLNEKKTCDKLLSAGKKNLSETMKLRKGAEIKPEFDTDETVLRDAVQAMLSEKNLSVESYRVDVGASNAKFTIETNNTPIDYKELSKNIIEAYEKTKSEPLVKAKFADFIWPTAEDIQKDFDIEAKDAGIVKENGVSKINGHVIGRKINFEELQNALQNKEESFDVSYEVIKPKIYTDDLGDESFPDLLGKYSTNYSEGNVGRSTNIRIATSKINGYVMNNGDVFSFNGVVGPRTYAAGFKDAPVFSGNGVENGIGGGICQVSSTLYPAVLYSNMKITQRRNHNFVVGYTVAGLDATVSYGSIDFKFQNNLKNPVKIKATASGGVMTVRIYGTKENSNTIVLDTKKLGTTPRGVKRVFDPSLAIGREVVTQSGYDGLKVQTYKYIKSSGGEIISTENLGVSTYIPLNKQIKYNDGHGEIEAEKPENSTTVSQEMPVPQAPSVAPPTQQQPSVQPQQPTQNEQPIQEPAPAEPLPPQKSETAEPSVTEEF